MKPVVTNSYLPLKSGPAASETSFGVNLAALLLSIGLVFVCHLLGIDSAVWLALLLIPALLLTTTALETLCFPKTCALRQLRVRRALSLMRVAFRETALLVTLAVIAAGIWLFPAFCDPTKTDAALRTGCLAFLWRLSVILLLVGIPYFCLMDRLDPEDEDVMCRLGRTLLTGRPAVTRFELANYARAWLVKAFFLMLMTAFLIVKIKALVAFPYAQLADTPDQLYDFIFTLIYVLDVSIAAGGYTLNLRLINAQTRTAEPTLFGWLAAIMCYWPFWDILFGPYFLDYAAGGSWQSVFAAGSAGWWTWLALMAFLGVVYVSATVAAGIRFSNLTYRGLWNTGPYRLTKHPAYVAKNIMWWLMFMPFVISSGTQAVRYSVLLLILNGVYYLRARTEERHLSHYPEYVAYALEMNRKSIFRGVARLLPFLAYRPPKEEDLVFRVSSPDLARGV